MSCKHGNYEGINGRDCDLCDAEDAIWKICAAKDVEIADLKAAYESLFKENAARRSAILASPAPSVGEPVACWACNDTKVVTTSSNGSGLIEAPCACTYEGATPPAAPAATEGASDAMRLVVEALEHSAPVAAHYPQPRERHAAALKAARALATAVGASVQPVPESLSDERYRKLREWYLRGGTRAEIHPFGHVEVTTPEIFDAGVDALASPTPTKGDA